MAPTVGWSTSPIGAMPPAVGWSTSPTGAAEPEPVARRRSRDSPTKYASARDSILMYGRGDAGEVAAPSVVKKPTASLVEYDEFAIGWNELFDQEGGWEQTTKTKSAAKVPMAMVPLMTRRPTRHSAVNGGAFYNAEVLTSKKPPVYLRAGGGKRSAIDKGMKERLMDCRPGEMRKPAEVMERQLDLLRARLAEAHRKKRREARQHRRLQRRCQVKGYEDVDELEELYANSDFLKPMFPGLLETAASSRTPRLTTRATKDFFVSLGRQQLTPRGGGGGGQDASLSSARPLSGGSSSTPLSARYARSPTGAASPAFSQEPSLSAR